MKEGSRTYFPCFIHLNVEGILVKVCHDLQCYFFNQRVLLHFFTIYLYILLDPSNKPIHLLCLQKQCDK